uniref:Uncharacterized protein n=1 Tax=Panagrolaimus davidi TaxID=227884 RepID=A0A914PUL3_9BILA
MCTTNGKNIMVGSGCFEDFDSTCGNVDASDKDVISNNLQNSFHFGSNFVAASCSHEDHCSDLELKRYKIYLYKMIFWTYINKEAFETFTKKVDKSYGRECVYHRLTTSIASFSSINVQLFGLLIFGFILIRLW